MPRYPGCHIRLHARTCLKARNTLQEDRSTYQLLLALPDACSLREPQNRAQ